MRSAESAAIAIIGTVPASAEVIRCDLADLDAAKAMIAELAGRLSDWRAQVNSASIFAADDVGALDPDILAEAIQVNARAPVAMAQDYLRLARSSAGRRVIPSTSSPVSTSTATRTGARWA